MKLAHPQLSLPGGPGSSQGPLFLSAIQARPHKENFD
jgi:hypothetical protein